MMTNPTQQIAFETKSYVLVEYRNNTLRKGPKGTLLPFLKGPMRVTGLSKSA